MSGTRGETAIIGRSFRWTTATQHDDGYTLVLDSMTASCHVSARMIHKDGATGVVTIAAADLKASLDLGLLVPVDDGSTT